MYVYNMYIIQSLLLISDNIFSFSGSTYIQYYRIFTQFSVCSQCTHVQKDFTDDIQMRPQKLRLKLRAGKPQQFTLNFRPSRNFPLDVYFLLDVTGSFSQRFRDTVTPLATELVSALQTISERYAVAFGGFGDKRAIPYALPNQDPRAYITNINFFGNPERCANQLITNVADCNPTISFRHTTALSPLTTDQLQQVLANISIHPNVDSLEGGMDGLVQVLTCTDHPMGFE
ncbi:Integrin beta-nu [Geodia barretti]|uniref:Integrin beta n=1 Tax=Geodia barretti TaxID=519541 RepID=A0AA35RT79_GEOBA|nr:Integrin beta-nu [Geodia barretti]